MGLQQYRQKRNFKVTPEPLGASPSASTRPQFVIQKHAASRLHYDFRLELDGTLKSWAVPKGPSLDPSHKRLAVHVEDHPLEYGSFEGIIPPKQYGAGTVLLWDRGSWAPIGDPLVGYRRGRLKFSLDGQKLHGLWNLVRMGARRGEGKENWLLIKEKDGEARSGKKSDVTENLTESVASGRTIEQIASSRNQVWQSNRPAGRTKTIFHPQDRRRKQLAGVRRAPQEESISPQLATLADEAPVGEEWVHELKYDGYRILCRVKNESVRLVTRTGRDWTSKLQRIAGTAAVLPVKTAWLDGEVVALRPDGSISFQNLQNAFDTRSETNLVYYVFDLLYLNGYDLRQVGLLERKQALAAIVPTAPSGLIRYSDHVQGRGEVVFAEACRNGMEGIISKRTQAVYRAGRNGNWIKVKCGHRQEFVIGGFTEPSGSRVAFGALLLGVYDEQGQFQFVGRTGTGFSERSLKELHRRLIALKQPRSPFEKTHASGIDPRGVHWVTPRLVAEISFAEWTNDGLLRQAVFQGLRQDKAAKSVVKEGPGEETSARTSSSGASKVRHRRHTRQVRSASENNEATPDGPATVAGVTITHPHRILFPDQGFTKLALSQYYERVCPWLLPHLQGRPLTLVRCPEGYNKECFYQKHATDSVPDTIDRVKIPNEKGVSWYLIAESLPAIIGLVQMGVLELHTWGSKRDGLDRPDRIVLDLDPDSTVPWKFVVEAAQLVRTLLSELDLASFVKTTGGKGLHVVLPLQRVHTWEDVKAFSKGVADHLVQVLPERFIANMSKQKRKGKIYVDYLRNARGATAIAPYSTRARPGAPVSVPLAWEELSVNLESNHFTVANVEERLNGLKRDPWQDYFTVKQKLTRKMKASLGILE